MDDISKWLPEPDKITELIMVNGGKFLMALITLLVGMWLIKRLSIMLKKIFALRSFEQTLQSFLISFLTITLKILLIISVVSMLGVQMTSFIALLGAAGLAIGMALSGTLQNFAGGVVLLVLKPFKAGDFIEVNGFNGIVSEIQIFHTVLLTPDNKTVIIPNAVVINNTLTNFTRESTRRVDWTIGIDYGSDIDLARSVVLGILNNDGRVLKDPAPMVVVSNLADSSVDLSIRGWTLVTDYWAVFWDVTEKVKKGFDAHGVIIPFPQRTVHLQQEKL
jgi:small conductance mechanosensitive channel